MRVRRFHRFVVQRVGALDDRFLALDRPYALSRLLWEIGIEGAEIVMLRSRLGIDSGQLSRMLRALEADGLVELTPSVGDGRVRMARLTEAGSGEWALLDQRSDAVAESILEPLTAAQRMELVDAIGRVQQLYLTSLVDLRLVDPEAPDAQRCLRAYISELHRRAPERDFDPDTGATAHPHEVRPPSGAFVVIYLRDEPVGCGAVKHHPGRVSDIKRMWIAESARGMGLSRRLLHHLEGLASEHGSTEVHLETNDVLSEALSLYRTSGYVEVPAFNNEPFADRWFAKPLPPRQ
jgi:DNA-binding MarR family transcriptional regulator/GNAT superfamily N-acetyltransferase